jgi:hypothetical protein
VISTKYDKDEEYQRYKDLKEKYES